MELQGCVNGSDCYLLMLKEAQYKTGAQQPSLEFIYLLYREHLFKCTLKVT